MESNGRISFLPKAKYAPLTPNDMKIKVSKDGLCANLIIDGNIMEEHLKNINKDKKWLIKRLENEGVNNYKDILLLTCDVKEKFSIYYKYVELDKSKILE